MWVTETAETEDTPASTCFVEMDLPPNCSEKASKSKTGIRKSVKDAVYKEGLTQYGGKELVVLSVPESFRFDFVVEEIRKTVLRPPQEGEEAGTRIRTTDG